MQSYRLTCKAEESRFALPLHCPINFISHHDFTIALGKAWDRRSIGFLYRQQKLQVHLTQTVLASAPCGRS